MRRILLLILYLLLCATMGWADTQIAIGEIPVQTVAMESADQNDFGQYLVASVIVNRSVASHKSLSGVCKAPKQFSCWNSPNWTKAWLDRHYTLKTRLRAYNALKKAIVEPYPNITHYHTRQVKPYWAKGHKPVVVVGNYLFYDDIQ